MVIRFVMPTKGGYANKKRSEIVVMSGFIPKYHAISHFGCFARGNLQKKLFHLINYEDLPCPIPKI